MTTVETAGTADTGNYGLVIGGYRVKFLNMNHGIEEKLFAVKEDAKTYLAKYEAYGYKGLVESLWFNVKVGA